MWKSTSGSTCGGASINSCERIRPERTRNPIQRLVWGPSAQFQVGYPGIITTEDELACNPRVALRRCVTPLFLIFYFFLAIFFNEIFFWIRKSNVIEIKKYRK